MAALQRAVAFAQVHDVAVHVAEDLDFHVARLLDVLLEVDRAVLERLLGFAARGVVTSHETGFVVRDAHAAPTATSSSLHENREADLARNDERLFLGFDRPVRARHARNTGLPRQNLRRDLVATVGDRLRRRPDELDVAALADLGEVLVLAEEAVSGMDGLDVRDLGSRDQRRDVEVALGARRLADADRLVSESQMQRIAVRLGVDRNGLDAEVLARAQNAQRDLATIGDEDAREHGGLSESRRGVDRTRPDRRSSPGLREPRTPSRP